MPHRRSNLVTVTGLGVGVAGVVLELGGYRNGVSVMFMGACRSTVLEVRRSE